MAVASLDETPETLLAKLVAIPSVNPVYGGSGEGAITRFVLDWLKARGIGFRLQSISAERSNVIVRVGPDGRDGLLLEAHMDTVGVEGWSSGSPYDLVERDGRLYGRGACDTKASLACFLLVLEHFHRHPEALRRPLIFAASVDEENEQLGALALAPLLSELGVSMALTGEPTRSRVVARHKGVCRYKAYTRGRAAHGSSPELGNNAIYAAAELIRGIAELARSLEEQPRLSEMERGTINLGVIRGGSGFNVVADSCELDLDRRLGVEEDFETAARQLLEIVARVPGAHLETALERPPLRGLHSGELVSGLLDAAREAGHSAERIEAPYMTNAVAYEAVGVPAAVFGPGDIAQAHKVDEYIDLGEMERTLAILVSFLSR